MKVIDMHCDTISRLLELRDKGQEQHLEQNEGMVDLRRMRQADYLVQNFALFVDKGKCESPYKQAVKMLYLFKDEMELNSEAIKQIFSAEDIRSCEAKGKLAALLTLEEGGICEGNIEKLNYFYEQGVRMMTITWNYPNELGFPNYSEDRGLFTPNLNEGLTKTGIEFVREMERIGMIVDVSHLSDAGFYDVLHYTKKPFVASHSNARELCPVVRNLTDDMIKKLAERGGVIGLNYCADFIKPPRISPLYDRKEEGMSGATLMDIAHHARHIADVGGVDCLGLGSDFDGIPENPEMRDVSEVPRLIDALTKVGFHESEIEKIFYKNVYRVYEAVI